MTERGQAMVESLLLGLIILLGISFSLRYALKIQKHFALDEMFEETLICLIGDGPNCLSHFQQALLDQGYHSISVRAQKNQSKWNLNLKAVSVFDEKIEKESELEYDFNITY